ncbi:MAG: polyprenol monophosphomannose synthase [Flavobacteriales bacterium]|nr:polyprenol monophosphomannose synthase [Flavobacteriales bacterium]MBK7086481.1 polyprenol monophosphomannose synthase [Flavobacteriales bacterium]MBK7270863.1 polyprenol monophosphomannose synthase [Flavobacteriales bacterium]MBK7752015.1 polyprenol monophosphomannose synthase [Flavobacteriales bacterium]MBK9074173.1 polyprenol monophosphomannose synthase [Flavobacteriales bacterium]
MPERLVIVPTYNEKENIREILGSVLALQPSFETLVVDDNSPDGTAAIVRDMITVHPGRIHLLERKGKLGLGTAYIAGFRWAMERGYGHVFEMDADFSHDPKDLPRLYAACAEGGADMSVGSRYVKGGKVSDWSWDRVLLSYTASLYVRAVLWLGVRDTTAGFVCYTLKVLKALPLDDIHFVGYAFQIEMKYRVKRLGFRIAEVPITFRDRVKGTSKMSASIFHEAFLGVLKMRRRIK